MHSGLLLPVRPHWSHVASNCRMNSCSPTALSELATRSSARSSFTLRGATFSFRLLPTLPLVVVPLCKPRAQRRATTEPDGQRASARRRRAATASPAPSGAPPHDTTHGQQHTGREQHSSSGPALSRRRGSRLAVAVAAAGAALAQPADSFLWLIASISLRQHPCLLLHPGGSKLSSCMGQGEPWRRPLTGRLQLPPSI